VSTGCVAPAPPAPNAALDTGPIRKTVLSGRLDKFDYWYSTNPDCTARGYPDVRVVTPPAHGTITLDKGEDYPFFPDDNVRKACNKQKVPATQTYYQSHPGFSGTDTVEVEVLFPGGRTRRATYAITVWPALPK
jgi:hypothetical protein